MSDQQLIDNQPVAGSSPSLSTRILNQFTIHRDWTAVMRRVGPRVLAGIGALILASVLGVFALRVAFEDKIYPAVVVGDVPVGGLTVDEATDLVQDRANQLDRGSITFTYQGHTWSPTLGEIGANIQTDDSVASALARGREDNAVTRFAFSSDILNADQTVPLETTLDDARLNAWFDKIDADIANPAIDATIVITGTEVSFTPDSTGIVVDRVAAREQIVRMLTSLQPIDAYLPTMVDEPELRAADLEAGREQVLGVISKPVNVLFENQAWQVAPEVVTPFMRVTTQRNGEGVDVTIDFDRAGLASVLRETFAASINREPVNATVAWEEGLVATTASVDGANLLSNEFADAVAASFIGGHHDVQIPVMITKPQIDSNNLAALGISELIGRGDSNFSGGTPERDTNIYVGIELMNNELVPPGGLFSFNGAVGAITPEAGFVEGSVIDGESIGRDVGGGICQVSTTAFRAALMAGLPTVSWYPHSYRLPGYELDGWGPGFDASILQVGDNPANWADFSFTNTTDSWILVKSFASYPWHIVEIYGHNMGWNVNIHSHWANVITGGEDKWKVDAALPPGTLTVNAYPQDGLDTGFTRTVTDANGNVILESIFHTGFRSRGFIYNASPDMEGKKP